MRLLVHALAVRCTAALALAQSAVLIPDGWANAAEQAR
jgi:hypothetical protein